MIRQLTIFTLATLLLLSPFHVGAELADVGQLIESGRYQQALSALDKQSAGLAQTAHYQFYYARALQGAGQLEKAIQQYEALIKAFPELPESYNNLAVIYIGQGKMEKAQALLNQAMLTHPGYARVYKNLVAVNAAQARDAYARALQMPTGSQMKNLHMANRLSLPATKQVIVSTAPIVTAATQSQVKPAMVYQAGDSHADKKQTLAEENRPVVDADRVKTLMMGWAKAWSEKNVEQYISFYSDDYSPGDMSRSDWVLQRSQRIRKPKWIQISLQNLEVSEAGSGQLRVRLEQEYRADNYRDVTRKEFILQQFDGEWRIIKERGLGYLRR